MATVQLKGLHIVRSKGRTYYYVWRGGPRIEAPYGTPEFHAEFSEAKNPVSGIDKRKFNAWITLYKASDEYKSLAETTKRTWRPWLDHIKDEFGDLLTRQFDRARIRVDIRHWLKRWKGTPRAADTGKQVLSRVLSFIVAEGGLSLNMCEGIPNVYSSNRAEMIWQPDQINLICGHLSPEFGWMVKISAMTGLREGDLPALAWSHVGKNAIEMPTSKGRKRCTVALIPITSDIRSLINSIPRRSIKVLTNTRGKPWKCFTSSTWDKAMKKSGLAKTGLHFHDLRGTAATNFYRAGLSIREIAEILGWSEDRVERLIDRYVKRDEILKDRIRRIENADRS